MNKRFDRLRRRARWPLMLAWLLAIAIVGPERYMEWVRLHHLLFLAGLWLLYQCWREELEPLPFWRRED